MKEPDKNLILLHTGIYKSSNIPDLIKTMDKGIIPIAVIFPTPKDLKNSIFKRCFAMIDTGNKFRDLILVDALPEGVIWERKEINLNGVGDTTGLGVVQGILLCGNKEISLEFVVWDKITPFEIILCQKTIEKLRLIAFTNLPVQPDNIQINHQN